MVEKLKKHGILFFLLLVGLLINFSRLFGSVMWADEIFSYELIQKNWFDVIEGTANDFHPPLYYLITKCFSSLFHYSIFGCRLSSFAAVLLLTGIGYIKIEKIFGKQEAIIFASCVLIAPTMYYSAEMRMYSWALCFVILMVLDAYQYIVDKKISNLIEMTVMGILAAYTHYFALIVVALVYFAVLLVFITKKDLKGITKLFAGIFVSIISYLPWFGVVLAQMDGYGKTVVEIKSVFYYIKALVGFVCLFSGTLRTIVDLSVLDMILTALGAALLAILLIRYLTNVISKKSTQGYMWFIFIVVLVGAFFAGVVMDMLSHTFVARYLYPITGLIWILASLAVVDWNRKNPKSGKALIVGLLLLFLADCGITIYQEKVEQKLHDETVAFVQENVGKEDIIVTDYALYSWNVLQYYFPDVANEKYSEETFEKHIGKYDDVWYVHAKQIDNSKIISKYQWEECLVSSLAENDCIIYKLHQE